MWNCKCLYDRAACARLLLFDRLHTLSRGNISRQQKHIKRLLRDKTPPSPSSLSCGETRVLHSAGRSNEDFPFDNLFISHRYNVRQKSARRGSLYFYKWTLKGNGKSDVSVRGFLTFILRAAFRAWMLIIILAHGYTFTHFTPGELLTTTTASKCRLLSSSSRRPGVKVISTGLVEEQIGILVIKPFLFLRRQKSCFSAELNKPQRRGRQVDLFCKLASKILKSLH